jgi:hypothetical protein
VQVREIREIQIGDGILGAMRSEGKSLGDFPRDKPLVSPKGKMFPGWIMEGHSHGHVAEKLRREREEKKKFTHGIWTLSIA